MLEGNDFNHRCGSPGRKRRRSAPAFRHPDEQPNHIFETEDSVDRHSTTVGAGRRTDRGKQGCPVLWARSVMIRVRSMGFSILPLKELKFIR